MFLMIFRVFPTILIFIDFLMDTKSSASSSCTIPEYMRGRFYSTDRTSELHTLITERTFSNEILGSSECFIYEIIPGSSDALNRSDLRILFFNNQAKCYQCQEVYFRTVNIIQHKHSACLNMNKDDDADYLFDEVCSEIQPNTDINTLFRIDIETVSCRRTIQGCFHFTYEVDFGGGSICDSAQSTITACQRPGSVYVDNQVFDMNFGECDEVSSSIRANIRFQCMGSWEDTRGNIFSAVADIGKVHYRDRFRCLLTRNDQEMQDNEKRYSLSRWASCSVLRTPYDGDIRLILSPILYPEVPFVSPSCRFPRNFTGSFVGHHDLDSEVSINATHIHITTFLNQYDFISSYFVCLQHADSRYFTFQVDIGKCETHFVCFDFLHRRHNIIQFRQARSLPVRLGGLHDVAYLTMKFREACTWSKFTYERTEGPQEWVYSYFVAYPPTPISCPIGGRYTFKQEGLQNEMYKTEIRGVTERPRHSTDCREELSILQSCDDNPTKMTVDVSYCASFDHTGKPIGEYDIPDRELICVAYWMENMKSYLITYDLLDPVSDLRCWVYERTSWRDISMSRSTSYTCDMAQTANSLGIDHGSSLKLVLKESERLYDECPQRYDSGDGSVMSPQQVFVLDLSSSSSLPCKLFSLIQPRQSLLFFLTFLGMQTLL